MIAMAWRNLLLWTVLESERLARESASAARQGAPSEGETDGSEAVVSLGEALNSGDGSYKP
jgi:hypothetical protein